LQRQKEETERLAAAAKAAQEERLRAQQRALEEARRVQEAQRKAKEDADRRAAEEAERLRQADKLRQQQALKTPKQLDKEHAAEVQALLDAKKATLAPGEVFSDPEFTGERAIAGLPAASQYRPTDYRRLNECLVNPQLMDEKGFNPGDLLQGELGDCWFLSALSVS
jgi:translation initiation factor IF-2